MSNPSEGKQSGYECGEAFIIDARQRIVHAQSFQL